jgi:chemotaxis protein methyltransferase CheR
MSRLVTSTHTDDFRSAVAVNLGLQFDDGKLEFLTDVLLRRLDATGYDADVYLTRLEANGLGGEAGALAEELTVGETHFFRNRDQFRAFSEIALPDRTRARTASRQLRLLSAGCASGEEAYSLAIAIREARLDPSCDVSILGVDINPAVLLKASRARYSTWALRETSTDLRDRWFQSDGRSFEVDETVRALVRFEERNLTQDESLHWQPEAYDVIFCRNVLMYFTREAASAVVTRLARSLKPGGYLFLGHAETLRGVSTDFHLRHTHDAFYYQRKDRLEQQRVPASFPAEVAPAVVQAIEGGEAWLDAVRRGAERIEALTAARRRVSAAPRPAPRGVTPSWNLDRAFELLRDERFTEALDAMQRFPAESMRDPDALLLHGALLAHRGRLAEAEALCLRLLEIDELSAGAHYLLALCREGASDDPNAAHHDRVASYLDPGFAMPRFHLGLLARRRGDSIAARRELEHALVLLQREDASRVLLFGGGFSRDTLVEICRRELVAFWGRP